MTTAKSAQQPRTPIEPSSSSSRRQTRPLHQDVVVLPTTGLTLPFGGEISPTMPSHGPSEATSLVTFTKQSDLVSHVSNTLQPVLKLPSSGNQSSRASSSCGGIDSTCFQGSEFLPFVQSQMTSDDAILDRRCLSSAEGIPTSAVACNPFSSTITQSNFQPTPEKQPPKPLSGDFWQ
ncbi:hypothetical protein CKAN_00190800 [Cinnamomum micranthum f. kanehirae]|uniref:Uncharacterized protein n=1 Tax=Cinnamomum micranthum f. kanehirae TaxID=337451 RepID=A0A443N524_9MAGN|nr:hypothetical protein CKAN_00190800 [Cinnamomum micranthum f. kanehirae]